METSGQGQVVVSGCGTLFELEVEPNKDVIIDNGHVVCWDSRLNYNLSLSTSQNSGFLGNLVNSVTSGEGWYYVSLVKEKSLFALAIEIISFNG
jgi:uncharacterized protein (AIM24 family)